MTEWRKLCRSGRPSFVPAAGRLTRWTLRSGAMALLAGGVLASAVPAAGAATLPAGFEERTVLSGLTNPTAVRFASDGRVFVAEKSGLIKVFDSLTDSTPSIYADLRTNVDDYWDRGLLGMALDPNFATNHRLYVLYTYDAPPGRTAPVYNDACADPTGNGCVVTGQLSWLDGAGAEHPMVRDWCQQFPSHSIGSLVFGSDGALYVSGGEGASFTYADYGQTGNPCGDPPAAAGTKLAAPSAEGGSLRSQDVRTTADPTGLSGAILRLDPATGDAMPDNPMASSSDPNARRIIAYGLRNPFRITVRPGTSEVWIGDVGANTWEEIDRIPDPRDAKVENFGWPCYEGNGRMSMFDNLNLTLCESLYAASGAVTPPYYTYKHASHIVSNDNCPTVRGSSVAGLAFQFYAGGPYPSEYDGALFFADYTRNCIWAMEPAVHGGLPSSLKLKTFVGGAAAPVDLQIGPGNDLFYADLTGGTIRRISYTAGNHAPVAAITADDTSGPAPLTVNFDASGSTDADGDALAYAWDLDGDGAYDDGTGVTATWTYQTAGRVTVGLKVTDAKGASSTATQVISAGNTPPVPAITAPAAGTLWKVGDVVTFTGTATDAEDGTLPASALTWNVVLLHCPTGAGCHEHPYETVTGASGTLTAPDHEYPSYLELRLTATDSGGLTATKVLRLGPRTVTITVASTPGGTNIGFNSTTSWTPFTRTVIQGSSNTLSAPPTELWWIWTLSFKSWSDGGAATHVVRPQANTTYTAAYG